MEDRSKDSFRKNRATQAAAVNANPSQNMALIGVTGTNGKTTVTHLVASMLNTLGIPCGLIGTVQNSFQSWSETSTLTTPGPDELQALFNKMHGLGAKAVAAEVSSHALDQYRTWGSDFEAALFTNLTQDHLDYHGNLENYFAAKKRLFLEYTVKHRIIFSGSTWSARLIKDIQDAGFTPTTVGRGPEYHIDCSHLTAGPNGIYGELIYAAQNVIKLNTGFFGAFNIENLAVVAALGLAFKFNPEQISHALNAAQPPPGRLELVTAPQHSFAVFVDYAHTPDALESALKALHTARPNGRLFVVFGCGGDRDKGKRPLMAEAAEKYAHQIYVTSDNPRTENPQAIINDILSGFTNKTNVTATADRKSSIEQAITQLGAGDTLLIAGKGHEDYQIIGTTKHPFDDRLVAKSALKSQ